MVLFHRDDDVPYIWSRLDHYTKVVLLLFVRVRVLSAPIESHPDHFVLVKNTLCLITFRPISSSQSYRDTRMASVTISVEFHRVIAE